MRVVAAAGAGFLLAVLWFDLMFDVQVRGHSRDEVPASARDSIAAYYRRAVVQARPMNRLVAVTMLVTLGALVGELVATDTALWVAAASLALTAGAVGLAAARTVRNAARLAGQTDSPAVQSTLARSILGDHVVCVVAIAIVLVLQIVAA